jgi:hypothetical protein
MPTPADYLADVLPSSRQRVPRNTADRINRQIALETEERVAWYAAHPDEIDARLDELDAEWDTERTLEANAATLAFAGTALGATVDKRFLALPALVTAFLLQHATQGWCPPLPVLRRMGFRTPHEIERERVALKVLRGDFRDVPLGGPTDDRHTAWSRARHALAAAAE